MSGITDSSDRFIPSTSKRAQSDEIKRNSKEKLEMSKQGMREVKTGSPRKVLRRVSSPLKNEVGLNVKSAIATFESPISSKSHRKLNFDEFSPVDQLIKTLAVSIPSEAQQFRDVLTNMDPGKHTIQYGNHIIYVSKPKNEPISLAIVNLAQKAFAKGGFGKVYKAELINMKNPLVVKLSRKKLKSKDCHGKLIPLSKAEKEIVAEKGSSRGAAAKEDLKNEFRMMRYIKKNASDTKGIICDALIRFTYKNQSGFFINEYDLDGKKFLSYNPSAVSRYHVANQICSGYVNFSNLEILHRDIKLDNTLLSVIPDENDFLCEAGISDFGGACFRDGLFTKDNPYPSFSSVLGSGTRRNTSYQIACDINARLEELKDYRIDSNQYEEITDEIKQLMVDNDDFSLGILLYRLWTDSNPPFASYKTNGYLRFDKELTKEERQEVLNKMELEVYSACLPLSEEDAKSSVELVVNCLKSGLDISR